LNIIQMTALLYKLTITLSIVIAVKAEWSETYALSKDWTSIKISEDGVHQTAAVYGDKIYYSSDSGYSWTPKNPSSYSPSGGWMGIGMSSNGQFQTVVEYGGLIYTSINYGADWTASNSGSSWWGSVAVSSAGDVQYASFLTQPQQTTTGYIWKSLNNGVDWSQLPKSPSLNWNDLAVSGDGLILCATSTSEYMYISFNGGNEFETRNIINNYQVAMCSSGTIIAVTTLLDSDNTGGIYISTNSGDSFALSQAPSQVWRGIAVSFGNGQYVTALSNGDSDYTGGYIYQSSTQGSTWTKVGFSGLWRGISMNGTGQIQVAVVEYGGIYINDNYGLDGTSSPTTSPSQTPTFAPFLAPTPSISNDGYKSLNTLAIVLSVIATLSVFLLAIFACFFKTFCFYILENDIRNPDQSYCFKGRLVSLCKWFYWKEFQEYSKDNLNNVKLLAPQTP